MNLNGDEKRIRQLFLELRLEEERRTPAFAGVLRTMVSGTTRRQQPNVSIKLALAAAALIVFVLAAIAIVRQSEGSRPSNIKQATVEEEATPSPAPESSEAAAPRPRVITPRPLRRRHPRLTDAAVDLKQLFAWQSPTASLLTLPKEELLMSLPRLGESLDNIKSYSPDLWN